MKTDRLKVGIIGVGYIGKVHLEELSRVEGVEVAALADSDIELAKNIGERFGIEKIYPDWEELVNDKEIEVVHNCTPNNLHFEVNQKVIESGKDIFSEKPLALSAKESGTLVKSALDKGAVTGINFCYRYYPVLQEAAVRIRSGEIGEVHTVLGHYLQDWLLYPTDYSWRLDPKFSGCSNIMGDLGSHWCDLVQFITNSRIKEVMAELRTIIPKRQRPKDKSALTFSDQIAQDAEDIDITLDDYAALMIRFENGVRGTFTTCQVSAGRKCNIDVQIYGTEKSLAWNHERASELWIGHRNQSNEIFFESPLLQDKSTRHYTTLPSGHPMGYRDAVLNLFRDYYMAVRAKREGNKIDSDYPDFMAGHQKLKDHGLTPEFVAPRLWEDPRTVDGAYTSNDSTCRQYAIERSKRAIDIAQALGTKDIVLWLAREGTYIREAKDSKIAVERIVNAINTMLEYDKDIRILIEPKPNEPMDHAFIPTVGHAIGLAQLTVDGSRVGVLIESARCILAGLDPSDEMGYALAHNKLWSVHLNDQNGMKFDEDKTFGSVDLRRAFNQVRVLEENCYGKNGEFVGLDVKAMRTQKKENSIQHLKNSREIFLKLLEIVRSLDHQKIKSFINQQDYEGLELFILNRILAV